MKHIGTLVKVVVGILIGTLIGFAVGQNYERERIKKIQLSSLKYESDAAHKESIRFLDSLKTAHPELFKH